MTSHSRQDSVPEKKKKNNDPLTPNQPLQSHVPFLSFLNLELINLIKSSPLLVCFLLRLSLSLSLSLSFSLSLSCSLTHSLSPIPNFPLAASLLSMVEFNTTTLSMFRHASPHFHFPVTNSPDTPTPAGAMTRSGTSRNMSVLVWFSSNPRLLRSLFNTAKGQHQLYLSKRAARVS